LLQMVRFPAPILRATALRAELRSDAPTRSLLLPSRYR
jgi:hypothetical protein